MALQTPKLDLTKPDYRDPRWDLPVNVDFDILDNAHGIVTDVDKILATTIVGVDAFIYDTSKDSDGGKWRERCQSLSWYNEPLNTATRGATKKFPAIVLIVAETDKVTLYDATDPALPMWMVFTVSTSNIIRAENSSVAAFNGVISFGFATFGNSLCNILSDSSKSFYTVNTYDYSGDISQRNDFVGYGAGYGQGIIDANVNDVAMIVLPDAPINPDTGIQIPTIAVATDGGVSIIDGPAGVDTVVDIEDANGSFQVNYDKDTENLYISHKSDDTISIGSLPIDPSIIISNWRDYYYSSIYNSIPALIPGVNSSRPIELGKAIGGVLGLNLFRENPLDRSEGVVNYITDKYQSGGMQGDIKLATLADSEVGDITSADPVDDRSVNDNPLDVIGTINRAKVAPGADLVAYSGFSETDYIEQPYNPDLDFSTGDFYIMGWFKVLGGGGRFFHRAESAAERRLAVDVTGGVIRVFIAGSGATNVISGVTDVYGLGWSFAVAKRVNGILQILLNGKLEGENSSVEDVSSITAITALGNDPITLTSPLPGEMALWRAGAGAPSDEQIQQIYQTEKELFKDDAKSLLPSPNVRALSFDDFNNTLAVGTDAGAVQFKDLINVGGIALTGQTSNDIVAISKQNDASGIVTVAEYGIDLPELNIRDEFVRLGGEIKALPPTPEDVYIYDSAANILDIPSVVWTAIVLATANTVIGATYELKFTLTGRMEDITDSMRVRYRVNSGIWYELSKEAKDVTDTWAVAYFFPYVANTLVTTLEVEAQKSVGGNQFDIDFADAIIEKKLEAP